MRLCLTVPPAACASTCKPTACAPLKQPECRPGPCARCVRVLPVAAAAGGGGRHRAAPQRAVGRPPHGGAGAAGHAHPAPARLARPRRRPAAVAGHRGRQAGGQARAGRLLALFRCAPRLMAASSSRPAAGGTELLPRRFERGLCCTRHAQRRTPSGPCTRSATTARACCCARPRRRGASTCPPSATCTTWACPATRRSTCTGLGAPGASAPPQVRAHARTHAWRRRSASRGVAQAHTVVCGERRGVCVALLLLAQVAL